MSQSTLRLLFTLLLCLGGCWHSASTQTVPAANAPPPLTIHGGDLLQISVFNEPQLNTNARVGSDGTISMPLLGDIPVANKTAEEVAQTVRQLFEKRKLLVHPNVSVLITEYATAGISVTGEVQKPGTYTLLGQHTLLDAIAAAGGLTPAADTTVLIKRRGGDQTTQRVALTNEDAGNSAKLDIPIYPNDLVIVPKAGIVYVLGDVVKPGGFAMRSDGQLTVLQAISLAQGTGRTASLGKARLIRKDTAGNISTRDIPLKRIQKGQSEDFSLRANDIVFVPSSAMKTSASTLAGLGGAVATAAIYTAH
jgi:polysaccharide export outer membrane protein